MPSHPVELNVRFLVGPFVYFHTSCVRTAKALVRLGGRAGSPKPSLVAYVISTIISCAGSNRVCTACHSLCMFWTPYSLLKLYFSNFRVVKFFGYSKLLRYAISHCMYGLLTHIWLVDLHMACWPTCGLLTYILLNDLYVLCWTTYGLLTYMWLVDLHIA